MQFGKIQALRPRSQRPVWPIQVHLGIFIAVFGLVLLLFTLGNAALPAADDVKKSYFEYARRTLNGEIPYRDFLVEYPPLSVIFFIVPGLVCYLFGGLEQTLYAHLFHLEAFILEAATLWLSFRLLCKVYPKARAEIFVPRLMWFTLGVAAISLYILQRFDIGATFLVTLALYWFYANRPGWAGVALALGAATKLYPAIILPLALLYLWRYRGDHKAALRCLVGFSSTAILIIGPLLILSPSGLLSTLKYHSERGIQIETIYASVIVLGHYLGLAPATSAIDHTSIGFNSAWNQNLSSLSTLLTIGGLGLIIGLAWRATRPGNHLRADWLVQVSALAVLWFILANKVFSPQYVIWLLSFVPFWKGVKQPLFLLALLLSFVAFPLLNDELFRLDWQPMAVLVVRNGLLVIILLQLSQVLKVVRPKPEPEKKLVAVTEIK